MKFTRTASLNIALAIGLFASQRAEAQTLLSRNSAPIQASSPQSSPAATVPISVDAPSQPSSEQSSVSPAQPSAGTTSPTAARPTMTPLPGRPYLLVDPATGRAMPIATYVPHLRPLPAELSYVEGSPIPRGYILQDYHPPGLIIAGAVTLGLLYTISFSVAAGNNFDTANGWLAVPVVGPFGWLATHKTPSCNGVDSYPSSSCSSDESNKGMAIFDGLGQIAGAAMFVAGLTITRKHLLLVDQQEVIVAPYTSSTGSGLRILGRF